MMLPNVVRCEECGRLQRWTGSGSKCPNCGGALKRPAPEKPKKE